MINQKFKKGEVMALKDVIKTARVKQNLKQEDAARLIGVTVQTYSKWENGKTEPRADQVWRLSKILEVSTEEICKGEMNKTMDQEEFMRKVSSLQHKIDTYNFHTVISNHVKNQQDFISDLEFIYNGFPD